MVFLNSPCPSAVKWLISLGNLGIILLFVFSIPSAVLVPRGTKVVLVKTRVSFDSSCGERGKNVFPGGSCFFPIK